MIIIKTNLDKVLALELAGHEDCYRIQYLDSKTPLQVEEYVIMSNEFEGSEYKTLVFKDLDGDYVKTTSKKFIKNFEKILEITDKPVIKIETYQTKYGIGFDCSGC